MKPVDPPLGEELLFRTLLTLIKNRLLWGARARLKVPDLGALLGATDSVLEAIVGRLRSLGWVETDPVSGAVRLSSLAVREFMENPRG